MILVTSGGEQGSGLLAARPLLESPDLGELPDVDLERLIRTLDEEMKTAAADLKFEYAARLRDKTKDLRREPAEIRG